MVGMVLALMLDVSKGSVLSGMVLLNAFYGKGSVQLNVQKRSQACDESIEHSA